MIREYGVSQQSYHTCVSSDGTSAQHRVGHVNCVPLTTLKMTFNRGKTGIAKFINHSLIERA